jgi:hypothetical protein
MEIQRNLELESPRAFNGDDPSSSQRLLFTAFLIFSVCFYSYRFLFGMGSPLTTYYDSDAPDWLRASKDIIWLVVFLGVMVSANAESWDHVSRNRREHPLFFKGLSVLVSLFVVMGVVHLFYYQSAQDTFLYWIRYPLEYIPVAFYMPLFVLRWRPLAPILLGLGWLSVGFLFFEIFSDRQMGFYNRYGSVFGSPNDYGMFCVLFIIGLLVCARRWSHWLLLIFMSGGLILTLSRSAFAGLIAGLCSLFYLRRVRVGFPVVLLLFLSLASILVWEYPELFGITQVQYGLAHFDVDSSAMSRIKEVQVFQTRFRDLEVSSLLWGTDYFHIESWYLALVVRTGCFGLLVWLVTMGASVLRGWRYRKLSPTHAIATASLISLCVASAFVPYPDTFPTNLYLWLAVGTIWMPVTREKIYVLCTEDRFPSKTYWARANGLLNIANRLEGRKPAQ